MVLVASWTYTLIVAFIVIIYNPDSIFVIYGFCVMDPVPTVYHIFQLSVNFLIPIIVIVTLNILLFTIANKHSKNIMQMTKPLSQLEAVTPNTKRRRNASAKIGANIKAAKRILLLVGVFVVCWLTYILSVAHNMACNGCHPRELTWMANVVNYSSCAINPMLYGLLNKTVRREAWIKLHMLIAKCLGRDASRSNIARTLYEHSSEVFSMYTMPVKSPNMRSPNVNAL